MKNRVGNRGLYWPFHDQVLGGDNRAQARRTRL